jgi:UDP-N-acetylmuramate--alanine ligase
MLAQLMESRRGVAIAGTHGKSTTTAMAGEILLAEGLSPTVVTGAASRDATSGGRLGRGRLMLAEACEYRAHFLHLTPQIAVVLSVEPDHFDCFASHAELEQAFGEFVQRVPSDGLVLWSAECGATRRAVGRLGCAGESFGLVPAAIWRATDLRHRRGFYTFQVRCRERLVCDVALSVPGRHNVLNALAAAAVASHCGATGRAIRAGLTRFAGLARRTELVSDDPNLAVVDDYAHHPTEVRATLASVREMFPGRRVWCAFQPHQESRTRRLLEEFAHSLQNADRIIVTDVFRAREPDDGCRATVADLALRIAELGANVVQLPSAIEIERHLWLHLEHADVLVTIGAGDIGSVAHGLRHGIGTFRKAG